MGSCICRKLVRRWALYGKASFMYLIVCRSYRTRLQSLLTLVLLCSLAGQLPAAVPVSGVAVPELSVLEQSMSNFMTANDIGSGQLSMMRNGVVIYHRSFGWKNTARTQALPLDSVFRIASISKPITAAAIRKLISDGEFDLDTKVFSLGVPGSGLLDHVPFGTPDARLNEVTVEHLLRHTGGWDRDIAGDIVFKPKTIAAALGTTSPPGRDNTVRWALGQPLQHDPGSTYAYSNFGYMLLSLIIEKVSGQSYRDYVHEHVFAADGVPLNDFIMGRTFKPNQDSREPPYESPWPATTNVFYPTHSAVQSVPWPYGGFDLESFVGLGGTVTNGLTLVRFLNRYTVAGYDIGSPRWGAGSWWWWHSGSLDGTNTAAVQLGEGINYAVLFNARPNSDPDYASQMVSNINNIIDNSQITQWPAKGVLPPTLFMAVATDQANFNVTLNGAVNPEGTATTGWFEWGTTTDYGQVTTEQTFGIGTAKLPATATLTNLETEVYHYRFVASNANGLSYGPDQTVSFVDLAKVTQDPVPEQLLKVGQTLTLTVTATGNPAPTYQWRRNTQPIANATSATYTFAGVSTLQAGTYDCVVSNTGGTDSDTSTPCSVGVFDPSGLGNNAVLAGATLTRTVPASGPGLGFSWLKDGDPINNTGGYSGTSTGTLKITGFNLSHEGSYVCRVALGALTLDSDATNYAILQVPKVPVPPVTQLLGVGEMLTLSVSATGGEPFSYQWRKNNVAIAGAVSATYSTTAALTHAGIYTCQVRNAAGTVISGAAQVAVVNLAGGAVVANEGGTFTRTVSSSVTGLGFEWFKDSEVLQNGGGIAGAKTSKVTVSTFSLARTGTYVCKVRLGALSRDTLPLTVSMLAKPVVTPFEVPALRVSGGASFGVSASPLPSKFTISGLPSGLTYVPATGVISGIPNKEVSSFTLKISATNAAGTGPLYSVTGSVQKLSTSLAGTWNGLIPRTESLKIYYGGSANVVVAVNGTISGHVMVDGVRSSLSGRVATLPDNTATLATQVKRSTALGSLTMNLVLDALNSGTMAGTLTNGTTTSGNVAGWRNAWSTANPASAYAGPYTAAIVAPEGLTIDDPKGTGYALLTLSTTGTATWSGKLPDGAAISFSTTFGSGGQVPLYQMCYANKGAAQGWSLITPDAAAPYATNTLDGAVEWLKDQQLANNVYTYKKGFAAHTRTIVGGKYVKPEAGGDLVLGLPKQTTNNALVEFSEAGVNLSQPFLVTAANKASVPTNPSTVKLSLTASTGVFSGSFVMKDPNPSKPTQILTRTAKYYGALVPRLDQGVGYFMLVQRPDPVGPPITTPATAPVYSGRVVLR